MLTNTENSYGVMSRVIHWSMSVIVIVMIIAGFTMVNMEPSDQKWEIYGVHKATGLVVLLLAIFRIIWILVNTKVQVPFDLPQWQRMLARLNHNLLYMLLLVMPLSGALMTLTGGHDIDFYGLFSVPHFLNNKEYSRIFWNIHVWSAFILIATIVLHVSAALYVVMWDRVNTLAFRRTL